MANATNIVLRPRAVRGFTLLELLVVMSIMVTVSSILVMSYFGAMRGSSYTAAEKDVRNCLLLARQRACLDGTRTFFVMIDETNYVIVRSAGVVGEVADPYVYDTYADLSSFDQFMAGIGTPTSGGRRLFDMDSGASSLIREISTSDKQVLDPVDRTPYNRRVNRITVDSVRDWSAGDRYGFEIHPRQMLPKGFLFRTTDDTTPPSYARVVFEPGGNSTGVSQIRIIEKIASDRPRNRVVLNISPLNGGVTVAPLGS
jgi:prepilin-type N-terminal cleavage/methylation domain-containing protein